MTTTVIKSIGTGKDFANLGAFFSYLNNQDLVAQDIILVGELYENSGGNNFIGDGAASSSTTNYAIIRPAAGLGHISLDKTGPLNYGTTGIECTIGFFHPNGNVRFEGLRMLVNSSSNFESGSVILSKCKIRLIDGAGLHGGLSYGQTEISDCLIVSESGTSPIIDDRSYVKLVRNTVACLNTARPIIKRGFADDAKSAVQDNVFINTTNVPVTADYGNVAAQFSNNYTNVAPTNGAGLIYGALLVMDTASDFRPTDGSPLIGAGSVVSLNTYDVRNQNRGTAPDIGSSQRTPFVAIQPAFTASPVINGAPTVGAPATFTSGTVTGAPTPVVTQQWTLDGADIAGAIGLSYTPLAETVGHGLGIKQTATNDAGSTTSSSPVLNIGGAIVPVAPSAPLNVTILAKNASIIVTCTTPTSNGGAVITRYDVYNASTNALIGSGQTSPITVTGLPNTVPLAVYVKAVNSAGSSVASANSATVTPLDPSAPGSHSLMLVDATLTPGKFGQALTGGYAHGTSALSADKSAVSYLEFWFYRQTEGHTGANVLFDQPNAFSLLLDNNSNPILSTPGASATTSYQSLFGAWHHGYLLFSGTKGITFWVDGTQLVNISTDLTTSGFNPTGSELTVGAITGGTNRWGGQLDNISFGLGDKYATGIVVPEYPTNPKTAGLKALYLFEGDGVDTAGTTGTYANGSVTTNDLQGQHLVLTGTTYNGVTSGTATLIPSSSNPAGAEPKQVNLVITGTAWSATFDNIIPGNYIGPKLVFTNNAGAGVPLFAEPFSIISISGGGDLGNTAVVTTPSVSNVAISPKTSTIAAGATQQFTTTLNAVNGADASITYSITGSTGGSITATGLFTGPTAMQDRVFSIVSKSNFDTTQFDTASITVLAQVAPVDPIPVYPPVNKVTAGVKYGPTGVEYTGTYVQGAGASVEEIVEAIWHDSSALSIPKFLAIK